MSALPRGHLPLLLFKRAWLGRVKELLEALVLLHCWEKQRNDVMSELMAASRPLFSLWFIRCVFSEHVVLFHLDHTLLNRGRSGFYHRVVQSGQTPELLCGQSDVSYSQLAVSSGEVEDSALLKNGSSRQSFCFPWT